MYCNVAAMMCTGRRSWLAMCLRIQSVGSLNTIYATRPYLQHCPFLAKGKSLNAVKEMDPSGVVVKEMW